MTTITSSASQHKGSWQIHIARVWTFRECRSGTIAWHPLNCGSLHARARNRLPDRSPYTCYHAVNRHYTRIHLDSRRPIRLTVTKNSSGRSSVTGILKKNPENSRRRLPHWFLSCHQLFWTSHFLWDWARFLLHRNVIGDYSKDQTLQLVVGLKKRWHCYMYDYRLLVSGGSFVSEPCNMRILSEVMAFSSTIYFFISIYVGTEVNITRWYF